MNSVNLCFVTDDYYAMPTCVAITSAILNKNSKTRYNIYILCDNVSKSAKEKFRKLIDDNVSIKFIDLVKREDLSLFKIEGISATPTSIFKFYMSELLKDIEKVIFIDGDTIVKQDLSELYNINLNGNIIGAVKDSNGLKNKRKLEEFYSYFNSGIMLIDLDGMRRGGYADRLMKYRREGLNKLMDQDAFNAVLKEKTFLLRFKYNTQLGIIAANIFKPNTTIVDDLKCYWGIENSASIEDIIDNAVILHYTTAKPWKYCDGLWNDIWYRYYMLSPYSQIPLLRETHYLNETVNSESYKIGHTVTSMLNRISRKRKNKFEKKYRKFLNDFYDRGGNV